MLTFFAATIDLLQEANKQGLPTATSVDPNSTAPFGTFISTVLGAIMVIALISVLIFLVWGGLEWIMSGGEKAKVEAARNKLTSSIIGLIVLAASLAIYYFIQNIIGVHVFTPFTSSNQPPAETAQQICTSNGMKWCGTKCIALNSTEPCP